ncbi:iron complex transport system substrate-binding protein [Algoriphagus boseongensis]|uniref:Iron complex transport system substrate-binding protein n=1 Tax=Algoriphagus boseongensis TaxID=1442587 RepID=A0A4R6T3S9_9BACT|nr:ABC transporter substrate-binding protein [Algoriphagus boseongensis]TDQ16392.1 iron complex transport system substrate-binding protein [Algoriphagus boseongensis]
MMSIWKIRFFKTFHFKSILGFGLVFFLFSCEKKVTQTLESTPIPLTYAQGFELKKGEGFWEILVTQGYTQADRTFRYLVLEEGVSLPKEGFDAVVQLPVSKVVLTSTTQIPHLDLLGETELLAGFPQLDLISSASTRKLINQGKVKDLGSGPSANPELVIDLQPNWMMISTLGEDLRYLELFEQAGIPALINGEYVEQHPLGRAEWIKFTGVILGKYEEAVQQFEKIESEYLQAIQLAADLSPSQKPQVLSGVMYQDIWYAPGAESWGARILDNAGGNYVFSDQSGTGSLQLNYEFVLDKGLEAEFWIGSADFSSLEEMGKSESRYQNFQAWKKGNIYTYTNKKGETGGLEYFELGYMRPDLILKDLIKILHPELLPEYELYFYQKLP